MYVFLRYVLPWKTDLGVLRFERFLSILLVPLGAFVKKISDPMILNDPENTLPVVLLLCDAELVPSAALSTPRISCNELYIIL